MTRWCLRQSSKPTSGPSDTAPVELPCAPLDPRTKQVLDFAYGEARGTDSNYTGPEHLLLGVICETGGEAASSLARQGVDIFSARREVTAYLSGQPLSGQLLSRTRVRSGRQCHREIRMFRDSAEAAAWANSMLKAGYEISHPSTTEGNFCLLAEGWAHQRPEERDAEGGTP